MNVLPLNTSKAIQINPNLGIILTQDMEGWFLERYVNIFMIGSIIDYVDNVNYNSMILHRRCYPNNEVQSMGIINIIQNEIDNNNYLHIWVDEKHIPASNKYLSKHFVHPLMVYGYDKENEIVKAVLFNAYKGQILVNINYQDMINATTDLDKYYMLGGSDVALKTTASAYCLSPYIKSEFHIDVFAQQLKNYICCTSEPGWEWYSSCRAGVFESREKIFGIQIYKQFVKYLSSPDLVNNVKYKALHDFVSHKKIILDRLLYIQQNYPTPCTYNKLVQQFACSYRALERMRLAGIKLQVKRGHYPVSLCMDPNYLSFLTDTLSESYNIEMEVLPKLYRIIINLDYESNYLSRCQIINVSNTIINSEHKYIDFEIVDKGKYVSRIDIVCLDQSDIYSSFEFDYIVLNKKDKYYLLDHFSNNSAIRTITFPPAKLNSLHLYTTQLNSRFHANIYPLPNQSAPGANDHIILSDSWHSFHHIQQIDAEKLSFLITDEDPFIIQENIGVNADEYDYLHLRMSTIAKTIYAQVYFSTVENPNISMDKSLFFKIIPDGLYHSYYINMSHNSNWKGFVKTIRIDPAQYHDNYEWDKDHCDICTIDKVEFVKNIPNDLNECMTASDLKDDGSTFAL